MKKRHRTVGMRIQEAREDAGMSRLELAKRTGVSYNLLTCYEGDKSDPTLERMTKIANTLDISLDWFAMGYEK